MAEFTKFYQILAMEVNVTEEVSSMDLNNKTIASIQTNLRKPHVQYAGEI